MSRPHLGLLFALLAGLLVAACASSPSVEPAPHGPWRVGLLDYRSKRRFELVNEAHTSRVEQYSQLRANADRKVQSDEIVEELVGWLESEGFAQLARGGAAPETPGADAVWTLELDGPGGTRHVLVLKSTTPEDYAVYRKLKAGFLDIYNATYAGQATQMKDGETPFLAPEPPKRVR